MFIRTKTTPRSNSTSIQLVESFRDCGKIKQRVVRHIGTADNEEKLIELKQVAEAVKLELENLQHQSKAQEQAETLYSNSKNFNSPENILVNIAHLEEISRKITGIHDVYGYVYDLLNFTNLFSRPKRHEKSAQILKNIVLARVADPRSKRSSVTLLKEKFDKQINLDHVYQMMDKIDDDFCERVQKNALSSTLQLTAEKLRVLFYDATTLYFESFCEDELKQNGYSKDMKFNQPQILLALFVTQQGLPVGYEIFPGSTFEGHTLIPVLKKLKERYKIDEVIFVADRGMLSEKNLKYLEENNFHYIVGARLKSLKHSDQKAILEWGESVSKMGDNIGDQTNRVIINKERKVVLSYCKSRAKKDKFDREKSVAKLRGKIEKSKDPKSLISNYGYQKFLKIEGETIVAVDDEKLKKAEAWDGITGVFTNKDDLSDSEILSHYGSLWQVEESFRINKHDLRMRPIFHWKENRVKAHIAICFMAFCCVRYLEYRVSRQYKKLSPEVIRKSLMSIQSSVIGDSKSNKKILLPSKVNSEAKQIYRVLGIKALSNVVELKA